MAQKELHAAEAKKLETRDLGKFIADVDRQIAEIEAKRDALMLQLPNLPHESIPLGKSAEDNPEIRVHGAKATFRLQTKITRRIVRIAQAGGFRARRETFWQRIFALHELGRAAGTRLDSISFGFAHHGTWLHGSFAAVYCKQGLHDWRRAISEIHSTRLMR